MKNLYSTVILFIVIISIANAQTPHWRWVKKSVTNVAVEAKSICNDSYGNTYVTGNFLGSATFGSISLTVSGSGRDIFVAKYDSVGNVLWAKSFGGQSNDFSFSIAADNFGNVYITGGFSSSSIIFGSTTLTNSGSSGGNADVFFVKISSLGNVLWAQRIGGTLNEGGHSVNVDANGSIYLTGTFISSQITIGAYTLTNSGSNVNLFVAKYNAAGTALWAKRAGGANTIVGTCVIADSSGNFFISGYFNGSITIGSATLSSSGSYDLFLAKYNAIGNVVWARKAGGSDEDYAYSVSFDAKGNSYIVGSFISNSITFGSTIIAHTSYALWSDMFIAKYDTSGNVLWVRATGAPSTQANHVAYGVVTDESGNSYVVGNSDASNFILGSDTLSGIFVAKYDSSGLVVWAKGAPTYNPVGQCVSVDSKGDIYIAGQYRNNIYFDSYYTSGSAYGYMCIAKIGDCNIAKPTVVASGPLTFCQGDSVSLYSSQASSYYWSNGFAGPNMSVTSSGNYAVTVSDIWFCSSTSLPAIVTVNSNPPTPTITPSDSTTFCQGNNVILVSSASSNIIWSPGGQTTPAISVNSSGTYKVTVVDSNSCFATSPPIIVTVNNCSGIHNVENLNGIKIYPNPFVSNTTVYFSEEQKQTTIKVLDVFGREIKAINFSGKQLELERDEMQAGIYFLQIDGQENSVFNKRIICGNE